jgi:hypothetical protein
MTIPPQPTDSKTASAQARFAVGAGIVASITE